jgi:hypothetical protein
MNRGVPAELVAVRAGLVHQDASMDGAHLDRRRPVCPIQECAQLFHPPKRRVLSQLGHAGAGQADDQPIAVDPGAGIAVRVGFRRIAVVSEHGAAAARRRKHPDLQAQASQHLSGRIDRPALRLHPEPGSPWGAREDEQGEMRQRLSYLERYQRLKRLEGELIGYATRMQQQGLAPEQTLRINKLLTTVRDAVLSAKAVKDVREDLVPLRHPVGTAATHPCETLHAQADAFYRAVDRLGPEVESSLLVQELARLRDVVRDQHQSVLEDLYRNAARNGLGQVELSSMLNLNRAMRRSARGLLRALGSYLLGPTEAEVLEQTGGD